MGHGLLHHPGRLDHLGQEHLARSEEVTHDAHAVHQRAFDHQQRAAQLDPRFFGVDLDVGVDALDQGVRKALLDGAVAPFFGLLFADRRAHVLQRLAKVHQALGRVRPAVEQYVFNQIL